MRARPLLVAVTGLALAASLLPAPAMSAVTPIQVTLNGQRLSLNPTPFLQNDRTLVPLRGVFEAMGATPVWDEANRTVEVQLGDKYVKLQIDRRLACLNPACTDAAMLDVPATLIQNRTFVPVRFIAQSLGANVTWDGANQTVRIRTDQAPVLQPTAVTLEGVERGQTITGPVSLKAVGPAGAQVFFYLVDPATRKARLVATGSDVSATYTYTPDPALAGPRHLVAAIRDQTGTMRYSDAVAVTVQPDIQVRVTGIEPNSSFTGPITFGHALGFVASHVTYRLIDPATGQTWDLGTVGPGDPYTWYPPVGFNGPRQVQALAYDRNGIEYASEPVALVVNSDHRTVFSSIKEGDSLSYLGSMLTVSANYEIQSVRYLLDGRVLSNAREYWWAFGPEMNGAHRLTVEVTDTAGTVRTVGPVNFTVDARPRLWLFGVGPDQVVTGEVSLKAQPNIPADKIRFFLREGATDTLIGERAPGESLTWTPATSGFKTIYAQAFQNGRWVLSTEPIYLHAYRGTLYQARPVVEKSQFKEFISAMAVKSRQETGMSAALQVAQAILETGWGQYVPVDKYTGQFSYNLFGMKGTGTAGSIVSTTWEVYNGQRYTVDANFRAYRSVGENWRDHKELLLTRSWYAPFRAVMADPVQGAWGLKRSGYATDPQYPIKLISIMKSQDLFRLDDVEL